MKVLCGLAAVSAYWSVYQLRRISICPAVRCHITDLIRCVRPDLNYHHLSTSYTQPDFIPLVISHHVCRKTSPGDRDSIAEKDRGLSLNHCVQTGTECYQACLMGTVAWVPLFTFLGFVLDESITGWMPLLLLKRIDSGGKESVLLDRINIPVISLSVLPGHCVSLTWNGVNMCRMRCLSVRVG